MPSVHFLPYDVKIDVSAGTTLIRAAMDAGVHVNASCGGEGVCMKCRVIIESGSVEGGVSERLKPEAVAKGYRLACLSHVTEDLVVRIPIESSVDAGVLNKIISPRKKAGITEIDFNQLKASGQVLPPVEKRFLPLTPPSAGDNQPDVSRIIDYLRLQMGERQLEVDFSILRELPARLREADFQVTVTLMRPIHDTGKNRIVHIEAGDTTDQNLAIAIDIGTTTVYGQLVDIRTGEILGGFGEFNGQISYGEDVISRIVFSEKGDGLERLNQVVLDTINRIIEKLLKKGGVTSESISLISIAGNTTMTQLFFGIPARYIRRAPYVPVSTLYPPVRACNIGLNLPCHVTALAFPSISSYVGGDIVAGILGTGFYRNDDIVLYMDIGTNAEIVVGNSEWLVCAACSAGPAFEGGGIEFGMRAGKGAIEDFSVDPITAEPMIMTIGNVRPIGICGSGLINMIANLFETGIINPNGKFQQDMDTARIRTRDGVVEYVVAWQAETELDRDLVLTEIDIENLIRAKGAIYSGYQTLLDEIGMSVDTIDRVIIAGGFGSFIDIEKAMTIGLLPEMDPERITYVGNASLMGAKLCCITNQVRRDVVEVTRKLTNFELSETASYMDHYMGALFLPHTDMTHFPKLKIRLEAMQKARLKG